MGRCISLLRLYFITIFTEKYYVVLESKVKKYKFKNKSKWKIELIKALNDFSKVLFITPNVIYLNSKTAKSIGLFPLFKKTEDGKSKSLEVISLQTPGMHPLEVILDESLKNKVFILSYNVQRFAA